MVVIVFPAGTKKARAFSSAAKINAAYPTARRPSQVKNYSPNTHSRAPSRGHQASSMSGLGVGCKLCSSSKELRGLSARAQLRVQAPPSRFLLRGLSCPPHAARRGKAHRSALKGLGKWALCLLSPFSIQPPSRSPSPSVSAHCATRGRGLKPPCRCWALEDMENWCQRTVF